VLVEICDEAIGQENDYFKREVRKLEHEVNKLKKQLNVQPPQDNQSNMGKKPEKEEPHQRLLLNIQKSKFNIKRMKTLNMQKLSS
jgi:hypothetical protein